MALQMDPERRRKLTEPARWHDEWVLPVARTRDEAHLYMDLNTCDGCGGVDVTWPNALADEGGVPARRYSGRCSGCGQAREFLFALPERPALPGPDEAVFFGGAESSQLLDAGEWLLISDLCAQAGSGADTTAERAEAREPLAIAAIVHDTYRDAVDRM